MGPVFLFRPPGPGLASLIREHQIIRFVFGPDGPVPAKPYWPRPASAIAFYPRDREWVSGPNAGPAWLKPRAAVIGQPTGLTWRHVGRDWLVYQIELQPGALTRLTGMPASRLQDQQVDAEALLPAGFRELVSRISGAAGPDEMIQLAEAWFHDQRDLRPGPVAADRLAARLVSEPHPDLDRLARAAGVGPRQLRRLVQARAGVGPKLLTRIARFDRVVRQHNAGGAADWLDLAMTGGYHDYQHLARDFRDFTGTSPAGFARLEQSAPERGFGFRET